MSTSAQQRRKNELAMIHIAKNALGLDRETYELTLSNLCNGKRSSADLDWQERQKVLQHFKSKGWINKPAKKARTERPLANSDQIKMIRGLWIELHQMGQLKDSSEQAINRFAKRQFSVDRVEWLDGKQASNMIEALKGWVARKSNA